MQAGLRDSWLNDMSRVLAQDQNYGNDTTQVEAALKKHEAVVAEIEARVSDTCMETTRQAWGIAVMWVGGGWH